MAHSKFSFFSQDRSSWVCSGSPSRELLLVELYMERELALPGY